MSARREALERDGAEFVAREHEVIERLRAAGYLRHDAGGSTAVSARVLDRAGLDALLEALRRRGYTPIGPTVRQGAIVYEEIADASDLPAGWTDVQDGGTYRLVRREDGALFGHNVGPNSWKSHLFPPTLRLWRARRGRGRRPRGRGAATPQPPRYAFIGVRSCDLHAIMVQDRTFLGRRVRRPRLRGAPARLLHRRGQLRPGGRDLLLRLDGHGAQGDRRASTSPLTEIVDDDGHRFLVEVGQRRGRGGAGRAAAPRRRRRATQRAADARRGARRGRAGPRARHDGHQGPALPQPRAPALGGRGRPLPLVRQLHAGLPDVLLQHRRGPHRPGGRGGRARARVGLVLLARALLRARRQRALDRRPRATASG